MRSDELDARSDIYSLGVVVYEMLTGRTPFHSDTPVGYLRKHMLEEPPAFRTVAQGLGVPPAVESAVMKALVKDRNQRYGSVLEFAQEFAKAAEAGSHLAAEPKPQREAAKPRPQATVTPVPKTIVPAAVRDTVAAKAIPEIAHPSRRKWLGFRWKRIGIVASIVWILGAGIYTLKVTNDDSVRLGAVTTESCHDANGPAYEACQKAGDDFLTQQLHGDLIIGVIFAFVPVALGWGLIYLVLFLVRWNSRPSAVHRTPQFRTAPEPPGKMKFVAIAGAALILVVAGVWYFLHRRPKDLNPDGSIKRGDVSWSAKAGTSIGEVRVNPNDGLKYVWVPPGAFMMGCSPGDSECDDNEKPPHQETVTKGFWLGQTEVTVGAYKRFAAGTGKAMLPGPDFNGGSVNDRMPIVNVTWDDAHDYCTWAGGRLPTEAEWEYAARAGSTQARYGDLDEIAWHASNIGGQAHVVAQKRANGFGLYDMLGNAQEWVNDWYDQSYYQDGQSQDPSGPTSGQERVLRGGSWGDFTRHVRVSCRVGLFPAVSYDNLGFRCGGDVFAPSASSPAAQSGLRPGEVETPIPASPPSQVDMSEAIPAFAPTPPTQAEQQKWRDWRDSNAHVSRPAVGSIPWYSYKEFRDLKEGERVKAIKEISYCDWTKLGGEHLEVRKRPGFGIHTSYIVETLDGKQGYVSADYVSLDNGVRCNESGCSKSQARENPKDGLKYVWIPPGSFQMGCSPGDTQCNDDEKPPHQVTITKGYWLGQTEVTVGAYKRFAGATARQMPPEPDLKGRPLNPGWGDESMPIVDVTWDDAQAYCSWARGRLPTEAEWEHAARVGSPEERYGPIDDVAWYQNNSGQEIHEVGQKRANGFGLYDVLGNVQEWVNDRYDENYYQNSPSQDPIGPTSSLVFLFGLSGKKRVVRGGSWGYSPMDVRVSWRNTGNPTHGDGDTGFRCVGELFAP
jgi:formylglycine-generating enzyme required for sulfatase activity